MAVCLLSTPSFFGLIRIKTSGHLWGNFKQTNGIEKESSMATILDQSMRLPRVVNQWLFSAFRIVGRATFRCIRQCRLAMFLSGVHDFGLLNGT